MSNDIRGPLELVTAPSGPAVDLTRAQTQCRVDAVTHDAELTDLIGAAVDYAEQNIPGGRQLLQATYDLPLTGWWCRELQLPRPPLVSVASVTYYDTDGTLTTLATTQYLVRTPQRGPGLIHWHPDADAAPSLECRPFPVMVRFIAGYASATAIPASIRQALLLLVAHWFDNKGAVGQPLEAADRLLQMNGWGSYR